MRSLRNISFICLLGAYLFASPTPTQADGGLQCLGGPGEPVCEEFECSCTGAYTEGNNAYFEMDFCDTKVAYCGFGIKTGVGFDEDDPPACIDPGAGSLYYACKDTWDGYSWTQVNLDFFECEVTECTEPI